ncbi:MAG TPA: PaaX family transcriptional regulator C-terminal domain-containing protein [Egibacteraceae bacterium]|nr:PaaX family transcriptional regulator C-terminal domain-containing protein [Egibacteraceae bacterium]
MRARSALFTLFGDVVRPHGGEAWLSTLTAYMDALGFTAEATRTALHRMSAEGWVEPRRAGRFAAYRLTARGEARLEEAAERIYRLRAADWDKHWRLLVHRGALPAAVVRELGWVGFGRLTPDVWVSPHPHDAHLDELLAAAGLLEAVHRFTSAAGGDADRIVAEAWDLSRLRAGHEEFLRQWARAKPPRDPRRAFAQRVRLVHHWRGFLFSDPGLPDALLPDDWRGEQATAVFQQRHAELRERSEPWAIARREGGPGR